jgi:hypothetical protein
MCAVKHVVLYLKTFAYYILQIGTPDSSIDLKL